MQFQLQVIFNFIFQSWLLTFAMISVYIAVAGRILVVVG